MCIIKVNVLMVIFLKAVMQVIFIVLAVPVAQDPPAVVEAVVALVAGVLRVGMG